MNFFKNYHNKFFFWTCKNHICEPAWRFVAKRPTNFCTSLKKCKLTFFSKIIKSRTFHWTRKMLLICLLETYWWKSETFSLVVRKKFQAERVFKAIIVFSNFSAGQVECSFDSAAPMFSPKVPKFSAENQKISTGRPTQFIKLQKLEKNTIFPQSYFLNTWNWDLTMLPKCFLP